MTIRGALQLKLIILCIFSVFLLEQQAMAADYLPNTIYSGNNTSPGESAVMLSDILNAQALSPGSIVIIGEIHDQKTHHDREYQILEQIAQSHPGTPISVGMEFFEFPDQKYVDGYLAGHITEPDFLSLLKWGSTPFDFYRPQVLFPSLHGGQTIALNAPRALTQKISKNGLASLAPSERELLPPDFSLGNPAYFERFREVMSGGHLPESKIQNYFEAQSTWDDTMAYQAMLAMQKNPEQILVIIVGDFHVAYGGGLPDRIAARNLPGANFKIVTFSQLVLNGLSPEEARFEILPHPTYGARADYVWTSENTHNSTQ